MPVDEKEINKYFSVDDVIASGGGRSRYKITEILTNSVRIQPIASKATILLRYDKLSAVIDNFQPIDKGVVVFVRNILGTNGLKQNNRCYLYGMAREYKKRKGLSSPSASDIQNEFEKAVEEAKNLTLAERKVRSKKDYPTKPAQVDVPASKMYRRNPYVVVEVLERANGFCERCKSHAPFTRATDKTPYLEVHHKIHLAHDGDDTVENAIALCPNCHRELHLGVST